MPEMASRLCVCVLSQDFSRLPGFCAPDDTILCSCERWSLVTVRSGTLTCAADVDIVTIQMHLHHASGCTCICSLEPQLHDRLP